MAVQYRHRILCFGKPAFETLNRLRRKRNFWNQHNRSAPAAERGANRNIVVMAARPGRVIASAASIR